MIGQSSLSLIHVGSDNVRLSRILSYHFISSGISRQPGICLTIPTCIASIPFLFLCWNPLPPLYRVLYLQEPPFVTRYEVF